MHKFLRAVGFRMYQKKRDIKTLLDLMERQAIATKCIQIDEDSNICEVRTETAPGMGIVMVGELDDRGDFKREYYYPYIDGIQQSSRAECMVMRHSEKETFSGMLDEGRVGISLIFYVQNPLDFMERKMKKDVHFRIHSVNLSGFSVEGKILLSIKKTQKQIQLAKVAAVDRSNLLEAAKNGDEAAMETLTYEDMDLYSQVSRRMMKEDLYSIIDSCFMPCGIECDQYSIIGEILEVEKFRNLYTKEEIYRMKLNCSDMTFDIAINSKDLLGEPEPGRRFKGQIWLQGRMNFEEIRP